MGKQVLNKLEIICNAVHLNKPVCRHHSVILERKGLSGTPIMRQIQHGVTETVRQREDKVTKSRIGRSRTMGR